MQIPRAALIHSATYSHYTGTDRSGEKTYGAEQTLQFVRFEVSKQNALTALGDKKNDRYTMYYDCENSLPAGITFSAGDKVTYGSEALEVRTANLYSAFSAHHWEIQLVGSSDAS